MRDASVGPQPLEQKPAWGSQLVGLSLDQSLAPPPGGGQVCVQGKEQAASQGQKPDSASASLGELPTFWLDPERRRRELALLGDSVAELLRDRDYSFILGSAPQDYALPALPAAWALAQSAIHRLLRACDVLNQDGLSLYLPQETAAQETAAHRTAAQGDSFACHRHVTGQQLSQLLSQHLPPQPMNLAAALEQALEDHYARKRLGQVQANGAIILVLFDGEPTEQRRLIKSLVRATYHIDQAEELGIGLLQIGENSIAEGFFSLLEQDLKLAWPGAVIVKFRKGQWFGPGVGWRILRR
ncbi:MAG: hypothetical protein HC771_24810 [Synechococcales cyanobacterium CRU_2_2]|nr:hypothetical protein [Synechococcales cyanobacterium CRU_2_2]